MPHRRPDAIAGTLPGGRVPRSVGAVSPLPAGRWTLDPIWILGTEVGSVERLVQRLTEAGLVEKGEKRQGRKASRLELKIPVHTARYRGFVESNVKRDDGELGTDRLESAETFE